MTCTTSDPEFSSDVAGDGPSGRRGVPVVFSVIYPRASIYQGLPDAGVKASVSAISGPRLGRARPRTNSFSSPSGRLVLASSSSAPAPIPRSRVKAGANSSASAAHLSTLSVDLTPPPFQATPSPSRRAPDGAGSAPPRSRAKARPQANAQLSAVAKPVFSTPEARGSFFLFHRRLPRGQGAAALNRLIPPPCLLHLLS